MLLKLTKLTIKWTHIPPSWRRHKSEWVLLNSTHSPTPVHFLVTRLHSEDTELAPPKQNSSFAADTHPVHSWSPQAFEKSKTICSLTGSKSIICLEKLLVITKYDLNNTKKFSYEREHICNLKCTFLFLHVNLHTTKTLSQLRLDL